MKECVVSSFEVSVTKASDVVSLAGIEKINTSKRLYKTIFKNKIEREFNEIAEGRWKSVMLIKEANEHAIKWERKLGKRKEQLTRAEQEFIKDKFFEMKLSELTDEDADELVKHLSHVFGDKFETI